MLLYHYNHAYIITCRSENSNNGLMLVPSVVLGYDQHYTNNDIRQWFVAIRSRAASQN